MDQRNDAPPPPPARRKHTLFWALVAAFIVASIVGMMLGDEYGQSKMGDSAKVRDAADQ